MANDTSPAARDLRRALGLLEAALSPAAAVEVTSEVATSGEPRTEVRVAPRHGRGSPARLVLRVGEQEQGDEKRTATTVLVLRRAPVSRLRDLRAQDRQFVDVGHGVVRIRLPWLYVDRSDLKSSGPVADTTRRGFRNPFGDRASLVTRLLVDHPERAWGARELAAEAGVSTMTASHVVRQLREIGAIEVQESGRAFAARIVDVHRLVAEWARHYAWSDNERLTVKAPIGDTKRFLRRLPESLVWKRSWALTLQAGAGLVAPHADWDVVHLYLDIPDRANLAEVAHASGWEPGNGKLVLVRPVYDDSIWQGKRNIDGLPVVSDLQLALDLWHYPVRGREQAEVILAAIAKRIESARAAAR